MNQDNTLCLHITKRVEEANYSLHYVANGVKVQRTKQLFTSEFWPQEKNTRKFLTEHWRKGLRRDAKECFIPISWNIWKALYAWRIVRGRWDTYYVNVMGHFSIISYFVRIQTEMFFFSGDYDFWYRKIPRILFFITFVSVFDPGQFVWSTFVLLRSKKKRESRKW